MLVMSALFLSAAALVIKYRSLFHSHRKAALMNAGLAGVALLEWKDYCFPSDETSVTESAIRMLLLGIICICYTLLALGQYPIFEGSIRQALLLFLFTTASLLMSLTDIPRYWAVSGQIFLVCSVLCAGGLFILRYVLNRTSNKRISPFGLMMLFYFPIVLVNVMSYGVIRPPAYLFEAVLAAELMILTVMLLKYIGIVHPASEHTSDITPSIRIAHSGVQVLNHSFKNKLITMEMAVGTIESKLPNASDVESELTIIKASVKHLTRMVNRLRERTKDIVLHEQAIHLGALINEVVSELLPTLPAGIRIHTGKFGNTILHCDGTHLREVMINILRNSIEAIGNEEGTITISLPPYIPGRWLTICFEDTGPGIPSSNLIRIFEPYFTTKSGNNNYGLGLSYCFNVMKASSGTIKINSTPGKGTTVILGFNPQKILVSSMAE